jgi:hypothetical protein
MNYIREVSKVIYKSKDGTNIKEFDALDSIASIASHICRWQIIARAIPTHFQQA